MTDILTAVGVVCALGFVAAIILVVASKLFFVPVDETVAMLREQMPGANCGACGFAGCDDYANALAADNSIGTALCPVGGAELVEKLSAVLGVEAESADPQVAVVRCNGNDDALKSIMKYKGNKTCVSAKQLYGGMNACTHGCLGLGDCEVVCAYDAIFVLNGVAVVDRDLCVACGLCAKACPNNIIAMQSKKNMVMVKCKSNDAAPKTMKACSNGCIGCSKCVKVCPFDSIKVEDKVAKIDPITCKNCGKCVKECPTGAIVNMRPKKMPASKPSAAKAEEKTEATSVTE